MPSKKLPPKKASPSAVPPDADTLPDTLPNEFVSSIIMALALTAPPVVQIIDSLERIFRLGVDPHLLNDSPWPYAEDTPCPAGHWILEPNTRLFRTDAPGTEVRPAVIIGCDANVRRWQDYCPEVWEVPCFIEVRYSRGYEPADAEARQQCLDSVFTHGLTPDALPFLPAASYLGFAPSGATPGLHIQHIHEIDSSPFTDKDKCSVLKLEFTLRCFAYLPDPEPAPAPEP
jgi:hypothetical protein